VLNVVRREIELVCPADSIPERIEVDLAKADIGDSLHISQVSLPANVHPTITDRDFTIATVAAPTVVAEEAAAEQEAAAEAEEEAPAAQPTEEAS
jgi:large subunit ribosomal protein L25